MRVEGKGVGGVKGEAGGQQVGGVWKLCQVFFYSSPFLFPNDTCFPYSFLSFFSFFFPFVVPPLNFPSHGAHCVAFLKLLLFLPHFSVICFFLSPCSDPFFSVLNHLFYMCGSFAYIYRRVASPSNLSPSRVNQISLFFLHVSFVWMCISFSPRFSQPHLILFVSNNHTIVSQWLFLHQWFYQISPFSYTSLSCSCIFYFSSHFSQPHFLLSESNTNI